MFTVLAVAIIATIIILTVQLVMFFIEHEQREHLRDLYDTKQDKFLNLYTDAKVKYYNNPKTKKPKRKK